MTRMTGPDCVVMRNLINTHTHTHTQHDKNYEGWALSDIYEYGIVYSVVYSVVYSLALASLTETLTLSANV